MPKLVPHARAALTAVALTGAVALLGCGQDAPGAGSGAPSAAAAAAESPLPTMTVTDVASGGEVPLADLLPADRPLLVWMWAPS